MASKPDDGGAAFPRTYAENGSYEGMSLRDWFAGQALAGLLASYTGKQDLPINQVASIYAYEYADAMLTQRQPTKET